MNYFYYLLLCIMKKIYEIKTFNKVIGHSQYFCTLSTQNFLSTYREYKNKYKAIGFYFIWLTDLKAFHITIDPEIFDNYEVIDTPMCTKK